MTLKKHIRPFHRTQPLLVLAILILISITAPLLDARVSWRWTSSGDSDKAIAAEGGQRAYTAPFRINRGRAHISVFQFEQSMANTQTLLQRIFPNGTWTGGEGTQAIGKVEDSNRVLRLILLRLTSQPVTLVIKIEQSTEDARQSAQPPAQHSMADLPEFPDSRPVLFAANEDTDMSFATASTRASAREILLFYQAELSARGWIQVMPGNPDSGTWIKDRHWASVHVTSAGQDNQITLLHKKH